MIYEAMTPVTRQEVAFPPLFTGMDSRKAVWQTGEYTLSRLDNLWWQEGGLTTRPSLVGKGELPRRAATPTFLFAEEGEAASWWLETYTREGVSYLAPFRLDAQGLQSGSMPPLAAAYGVITPWQGGYLALVNTGLYYLPYIDSQWIDYSDHIHIPTVMRGIRGRLPAEVEPSFGEVSEEFNTLTDRFTVTFTTDGSSSRFYLPVAGLNNEEVEATLLEADGRLSHFRVAAGQTDSAMQGDCFMRVNRIGGFLQFLGADGLPMPPGTDGREENLVVTAAKTGVGGGSALRGMRQSHWLKGDSHHALLMLTGDPADPSRLCWLTPGDTLYLPASQVTHVGDEQSWITAMATLRDRVVLFKPRSLYLMTVGKAVGSDPGRLSVTLYPSGSGCVAPGSVCTGDDRMWWLDDEGRVRCLTGSHLLARRAPEVVSAPIVEELATLTPFTREGAAGVWWRGHYLLRFDRTVWVLNPAGDHPAWSRWSLPEELFPAGWTAVGDRLELLCRVTGDAPTWVVYHLTDTGDGRDCLWLGDEVAERAIPYGLSTKQWEMGIAGQRHRIDSVRLRGESAAPVMTLTVTAGQGVAERLRVTSSRMREGWFPLRLSHCPLLGLELTGEGWLRLQDITFCRRVYPAGR